MTTAGLVVIIVLVAVTAGMALGLHLILRRDLAAVVLTRVVADGLLLLVSVPGKHWGRRESLVIVVAAAVAMAVCAGVGAPLALARKRRADAARGFDVLPPDRR